MGLLQAGADQSRPVAVADQSGAGGRIPEVVVRRSQLGKEGDGQGGLGAGRRGVGEHDVDGGVVVDGVDVDVDVGVDVVGAGAGVGVGVGLVAFAGYGGNRRRRSRWGFPVRRQSLADHQPQQQGSLPGQRQQQEGLRRQSLETGTLDVHAHLLHRQRVAGVRVVLGVGRCVFSLGQRACVRPGRRVVHPCRPFCRRIGRRLPCS